MNRVKKHLKPDLYLGIFDCVSQCLSPLPPFLFFKHRHLDYAFCHLKPRVLIDVASFYKRLHKKMTLLQKSEQLQEPREKL